MSPTAIEDYHALHRPRPQRVSLALGLSTTLH